MGVLPIHQTFLTCSSSVPYPPWVCDRETAPIEVGELHWCWMWWVQGIALMEGLGWGSAHGGLWRREKTIIEGVW